MSIRCLNLFKNRFLLNLSKVNHNAASYRNVPSYIGGQMTLVAWRCITTSNANMDMFNVQDVDDFKSKVLDSKEPVLVDFHAR